MTLTVKSITVMNVYKQYCHQNDARDNIVGTVKAYENRYYKQKRTCYQNYKECEECFASWHPKLKEANRLIEWI